MILIIGITLYTSRILLRELGIDDFGLYNLIAGIVAMFSSLRGLFASSIQRFLNYEMGRGNSGGLARIFSMSITIHLAICFLFFILVEITGLWFLENKLVIEPGRQDAAFWVLQFSIFTTLVTIMNIPYDAVILAYERMNIYAYISIVEVLMKLCIVFVISFTKSDKLEMYAILIFSVSILIRGINYIYCRRHFKECRYLFFWDSKLFRQLGGFAGWNFLGNTVYAIVNEGLNILLNIFGGMAINAGRGIAYQVRAAVTGFMANIQTAANPHFVKLYAREGMENLFSLLYTISKMSFFLMLIVCLPLMVYAGPVLQLWLSVVPDHTEAFVQLILLFILVRSFHGTLDSLFKASGKIKTYQLIDSLILFLTLPVSWLLLKKGMRYEMVFVTMVVVEVINLSAVLLLSVKAEKLSIKDYLKKVTRPCLTVTVAIMPFIWLINTYTGNNEMYIFLVRIPLLLVLCCCGIWLMGLTAEEKKIGKSFVANAINSLMKTKNTK